MRLTYIIIIIQKKNYSVVPKDPPPPSLLTGTINSSISIAGSKSYFKLVAPPILCWAWGPSLYLSYFIRFVFPLSLSLLVRASHTWIDISAFPRHAVASLSSPFPSSPPTRGRTSTNFQSSTPHPLRCDSPRSILTRRKEGKANLTFTLSYPSAQPFLLLPNWIRWCSLYPLPLSKHSFEGMCPSFTP